MHCRPGSMKAPRQNDASDRMVYPAKSLHRGRCKPDFVAESVAALWAEEGDKSVLDVIRVRDVSRPILRTKRPERYASLVLGKQCFGSAPSSGLLHILLLF